MASEPTRPDRPSAPSSEDLREYLPANDAATEAMLDEALAHPNGAPQPELVERLKELDATDPVRAGKPSAEAKKARPIEAAATAPAPRRPIPAWWAYGAVAAVFVPVLVTILVMRGDAAKQGRAAAVVESAGTATAVPAVPGTVAVPRATASAAASADAAPDASASAPAPTIKAPKKPGGKPTAAPDPHGAPTAPATAPAPVPELPPKVIE
jgi:biotin carboxyl carrier protein